MTLQDRSSGLSELTDRGWVGNKSDANRQRIPGAPADLERLTRCREILVKLLESWRASGEVAATLNKTCQVSMAQTMHNCQMPTKMMFTYLSHLLC
jgi:hypothetical protein